MNHANAEFCTSDGNVVNHKSVTFIENIFEIFGGKVLPDKYIIRHVSNEEILLSTILVSAPHVAYVTSSTNYGGNLLTLIGDIVFRRRLRQAR